MGKEEEGRGRGMERRKRVSQPVGQLTNPSEAGLSAVGIG